MQYVSDIISEEDIDSWNETYKILIKASCGTGKTHFVLNKLYEYARCNKKKILYLCNRNLLKEQIEKEIDSKRDIIELFNYQKMEYDCCCQIPEDDCRQWALVYDLNKYDYIVSDEAHYFFADSEMNTKSNLLLLALSKGVQKPVIFMTATPQILCLYMQFQEHLIYDVPYPPQTNRVYYYSHDEVIDKYIFSIPPEEKVIYFGRQTKRLLKLKEALGNRCMFVCGQSNDSYRFVDLEKKNQLISEERFEPQVLLATSALDNGINIKDAAVKHIICDYPDIITALQCIGRKRYLDENDKINIYIKNDLHFFKWALDEKKKDFRKIDDYLLMDLNEFAVNYKTYYYSKGFQLDDSGSGNPFVVVDAYFNKIKYDIVALESSIKSYDSFINLLCQEMGIEFNSIINLEQKIDADRIAQKLESMKDTKLFEEQQIELRNFFNTGLNKKLRYTGIHSLNNHLDRIGLGNNFIIQSQQHWGRDELRGKTYWKIKNLA